MITLPPMDRSSTAPSCSSFGSSQSVCVFASRMRPAGEKGSPAYVLAVTYEGGAVRYRINAPAILGPGASSLTLERTNPQIREALAAARSADVYLLGMGSLAGDDMFVRAGLISALELEAVREHERAERTGDARVTGRRRNVGQRNMCSLVIDGRDPPPARIHLERHLRGRHAGRRRAGVLRVGATRVTLDVVVSAFEQGATPEEILQDFPTLRLAEVYTVLSYYLQHRGQVDAYLHARRAEAEQLRQRAEAETDVAGLRARLRARSRA